MNLLGLRLPYVGGIIGAGLLIILVLYLRQWGRRRVTVAFTPLWRRVLSEADVGTSRRRVLEVFSVLLQLSVVALLAFALGRPLVGREPGIHAIVLDTSASMLAQRPTRGDRLSAAKQRALTLLSRLSDADRVALVTSGGEARLLFAPTHDHSAVRDRIVSVEGCACEGRLREAVEIARSVVPEHGSIDVLTDGNEPLENVDGLNLELFGAPAANVGITLLGVRPSPVSPGRYEGVLQVHNFASAAAKAQLRLSIDGSLIDMRDVKLAAGERLDVPLPMLSAGRGAGLFTAELFNLEIEGTRDVLDEDNKAFALLAPEAERPVRLIAPANGARFVREALRANPRYRLIDIDPGKELVASAGAITVVAGAEVPTGPGRFVVVAPPMNVPASESLKDAIVTDWRSDHSILHHVSLQGIAIHTARSVTAPPGAQILARFGNVPLLYLRQTLDRTEIGTTFDAEDSNLPLRVAFPVLLYNAIDWMSGSNELDTARTPGRRWRLERLATGPVRRLGVDGPSRHTEAALRGDTIVVENANAPGLYTITADDETFRVASSLTSSIESNLGAMATVAGEREASKRSADIWSWLVYGALAVLALEWLLYHRRVTA